MKCENCGKNEVSFVLRSNINGQVTEKHLCNECAEKLGYTQKLAAHSRRMMAGMRGAFDGFFGNGGFPSLMDGFFSPERSLPGFGGFFGEDLFDDFFQDMPALGTAPEQPVIETEWHEEPVRQEEQSRFARKREMNRLRAEMKRAVHEENFERAAELRDQIRTMEQEDRESK